MIGMSCTLAFQLAFKASDERSGCDIAATATISDRLFLVIQDSNIPDIVINIAEILSPTGGYRRSISAIGFFNVARINHRSHFATIDITVHVAAIDGLT